MNQMLTDPGVTVPGDTPPGVTTEWTGQGSVNVIPGVQASAPSWWMT